MNPIKLSKRKLKVWLAISILWSAYSVFRGGQIGFSQFHIAANVGFIFVLCFFLAYFVDRFALKLEKKMIIRKK